MFEKIQDTKNYPCKRCEKNKDDCNCCRKWQDCFRYNWNLLRADFKKLMRGEKIG